MNENYDEKTEHLKNRNKIEIEQNNESLKRLKNRQNIVLKKEQELMEVILQETNKGLYRGKV